MFKYLVAFLICYSPIHAQTFNKLKLDSLFALIESNKKGMGSFSIYSDGKEVYHTSFGFSDIKSNTRADDFTKYRIGSISKTFTTTIIMQLVDEGKVTLNTLLSDFYPKIPNANKITIENLLRHQSGLYNITEDENINTWISLPQSRQQMISRIIKYGAIFEPKSKIQYSNTNFILLSYIAEKIENLDFSNILRTRIIDELDLQRTEFGKTINPLNNEALPYSLEDSEWKLMEFQTDMSGPMGAGGIVSTPRELNIFFHRLFSGELTSANSLTKMMEAKEGMGLGLMKPPFGDKEVYGHGGSIDGFQSFAAHFVNDNVTISLTTNNFYSQVAPIFIGAVKIFFGMDYQLPSFTPKTTIKLMPEELNVYLGKYSSPDFPIAITITKDGNKLIAQGEGQSSFPLDAIGEHSFYSESVMITLKFNTTKQMMVVEQNGAVFNLTKE